MNDTGVAFAWELSMTYAARQIFAILLGLTFVVAVSAGPAAAALLG